MTSKVLLAAAVIVHDVAGGRIALVRNRDDYDWGAGLWVVPSGRTEKSEPVTTTAVRELKEEAGLIVDVADLHLAGVLHGSWGVHAPEGFLTVFFAATRWEGELTNVEPEFHSDVVWCDIADLSSNFVPEVREIIDGYLNGTAEALLHGWEKTSPAPPSGRTTTPTSPTP